MARILVVDDEPLVCSMLNAFLTREGHEVTTAGNGKLAIDVVDDGPIDLVIADIVMPEKDGLEMMTQLRKERPTLKIIAISGGSRVGNFDFLSMAKHLGASETFYKPLNNSDLLTAVNRCLSATADTHANR